MPKWTRNSSARSSADVLAPPLTRPQVRVSKPLMCLRKKSSCSSVYALGDAWVYSRPGIAGRLIVSHRIVKALINTIKFAY